MKIRGSRDKKRKEKEKNLRINAKDMKINTKDMKIDLTNSRIRNAKQIAKLTQSVTQKKERTNNKDEWDEF